MEVVAGDVADFEDEDARHGGKRPSETGSGQIACGFGLRVFDGAGKGVVAAVGERVDFRRAEALFHVFAGNHAFSP